MPNEAEISSFDSNSRSLCPDDLCIGLVAADGRCSVCGRSGTPPAASPDAPTAGEPTELEAPSGAPSQPIASDGAPGVDGDSNPDFAERRLCPDEACIGVLGADGRCRECGKAA